MHRLRFAPSPTGYLHVGGARTALFNWLFAKRYGGEMLLRIEDTDRARSTAASEQAIFDGLTWLGLQWDGEIVHQGANLARHQRDARALLDRGAAYRCFCTAAELEQRRRDAESRGETFVYDRRCDRLTPEQLDAHLQAGDPYVLRFRVPEGSTSWDDLVHESIVFPNKDLDDFVILRSDGTPIYNLAVVSDDIAMGITLVMRGDDHISNTPKQILLYLALGAALPRFAHLPMIHGTDGKKLSKRHGATAVGDYAQQGILPVAMVNFLALLGWAPGDDREVMDVPELVERFAVEGLSRKAAVFDPKKLEWMNGQHLVRLSSDALVATVSRALVAADFATEASLGERRAWLVSLIELLKVRARTIDDLVKQAYPYFSDTVTLDQSAVAKHWKDRAIASERLLQTRNTLADVAWEPSVLESALRTLAERLGVSAGHLFQPLRVALVGSSNSPGIFDVLGVLGRERSLRRIDEAVAWLRADR